jgi:hypothetical protein
VPPGALIRARFTCDVRLLRSAFLLKKVMPGTFHRIAAIAFDGTIVASS